MVGNGQFASAGSAVCANSDGKESWDVGWFEGHLTFVTVWDGNEHVVSACQKSQKDPVVVEAQVGLPAVHWILVHNFAAPTLESTPSLLTQQSVVLRAHACDLGE